MHSGLDIPRLTTYIVNVALELYAYAKLSRNRDVKKLGATSLVYKIKGFLDSLYPPLFRERAIASIL